MTPVSAAPPPIRTISRITIGAVTPVHGISQADRSLTYKAAPVRRTWAQPNGIPRYPCQANWLGGRGRDREVRQLDLMLDRLNRFRSGSMIIGPVISDLEALRYELHSVDEDWRERFRDAWSDLEIPYAVALDQAPIPTIADRNGC